MSKWLTTSSGTAALPEPAPAQAGDGAGNTLEDARAGPGTVAMTYNKANRLAGVTVDGTLKGTYAYTLGCPPSAGRARAAHRAHPQHIEGRPHVIQIVRGKLQGRDFVRMMLGEASAKSN